jgi:hypothetical protein
MPHAAHYRKVRVFVASPGDVGREREGLKKVIESLNRVFSDRYRVVLELKEWRQVVPDMGLAQEVILEQLKVEAWDVFVGILWLRFGMAPGTLDPENGRAFDSGTEQEFTVAHRAWEQKRRPRILFYRCLRLPPRLLDIDGEQFSRVGAFFKQFDPNGAHPGLYAEYAEVEDFKDLVREHLEKLLIAEHDNLAVSRSQPLTAEEKLLGGVLRTFSATGPLSRPLRADFVNPFIIGRPITDPADFFGREQETQFALARLRTRQSVSIVGERRIGKTSLLHFILHRAKEELGPQARLGLLDLMAATARNPSALLTQIQHKLGVPDAATTLTGLAERLAGLTQAGGHPVLAFDEMEMVIRFPAEFARDFFETLRAAAQAGHLTLLTASRISLQEMHEQGALVSPLYNIMGRLALGPFTEAEAEEFVRLPRAGVKFTDAQAEEILRRGKQSPLRLQVLCFHVAEANRVPGGNWAKVWADAEAEAAGMLEPGQTETKQEKA